MEPFKSVKQGRISEGVTHQIKNAIFKKQYKTGAKLPSEKELCEQFQASRGVIREAIRTLEVTGFISLKQGAAGGAFVKELSFHPASSAILDLFIANKISAKELLQVRAHIEMTIAKSIVPNISKASIALLEKAYHDELESSLTYSEKVSHQLELHYVLGQICENRLYRLILNCLLDLTKEMFLEVKSKHDVIHDPKEHKAIIEAIISGDVDLTVSNIEKHLKHLDTSMGELEKSYRKSRGVS
jgi:DNA-binding FadR family transcriptional regulator